MFPLYADAGDLHSIAPWIDGKGTPLTEVSDDIDGELRDASTPDMGADEFIFGFNYSPVITSLPDTVARVDSLYEYQVTASDNNGDTLIFRLTTAPSFLGIDSVSGLIQGTPQTGDQGEHTVVVEVDDQNGGTDAQTFTLNVQAATGIESYSGQIPKQFIVFQNYPNPFGNGLPIGNSSSTKIKFGLPGSASVRIDIFNMLGQKITTLVNKNFSAGFHVIDFRAKNLATGTYIYMIRAGKFEEARKMFILK